jgi:hypothetical protein
MMSDFYSRQTSISVYQFLQLKEQPHQTIGDKLRLKSFWKAAAYWQKFY